MLQVVALYHCMLIVSTYNAFFFFGTFQLGWKGRSRRPAKRYGKSRVPVSPVPHSTARNHGFRATIIVVENCQCQKSSATVRGDLLQGCQIRLK